MNLFHPFAINIPVVGMDISGPVVRAVQFSGSGKKHRLVAVGEVDLPQVAVSDPFTNRKETIETIRKVLEEPELGRFTAKVTVASLPEYRCFVRVIHVQPDMTDSEIDQAVPFEAESYIPVPLEQVYLDWEKIPSSDERTALLLAAAPKDVVDKTVEIFRDAGLIVAGLEVESMTLARGALGTGSTEDVLVVDIGTSRTDLVMVEQGSVQFASSIPLAEGNFTEAAVKSLGLSKAQAAKLVRKSGVENTPTYPNLRQILTPVVSMLAAEIRNIISFHDQHSPRRLSSIILVGRGAGLPHLDSALSSLADTSIQVRVGDPWRTAGIANIPESMAGLAGVKFTAAVGLALKGVHWS